MEKIISLLLIAMMCLSFVAPQARKTPVGRHILNKSKCDGDRVVTHRVNQGTPLLLYRRCL